MKNIADILTINNNFKWKIILAVPSVIEQQTYVHQCTIQDSQFEGVSCIYRITIIPWSQYPKPIIAYVAWSGGNPKYLTTSDENYVTVDRDNGTFTVTYNGRILIELF